MGGSMRRRLASQGDAIHEHDSNHATVFTMGTHVWLFVVCLMLLLMVVISVLVERGIHMLHENVPKAYQSIVHKVLEEFTIMGVVSFMIVLFEGIWSISHDLFLNFEFAHLLLFFTSIMLAGYGFLNLVLMRKAKKYFDRLEQSDAADVLKRFENFLERQGCRTRLHHMMGTYFNDFDTERKAAEHIVLRGKFFEGHTKLSAHDNFDFGLYLRKSLNLHIGELLELDPMAWGVVAALCILLLSLFADDASGLCADPFTPPSSQPPPTAATPCFAPRQAAQVAWPHLLLSLYPRVWTPSSCLPHVSAPFDCL